jgi:hypothetical protein
VCVRGRYFDMAMVDVMVYSNDDYTKSTHMARASCTNGGEVLVYRVDKIQRTKLGGNSR